MDENTTIEEDYTAHPHYKMYVLIYRYVTPVIIGIGVLANLFALIVLRSKYFRKVPSSFGFTLLSLVDVVVLTVGLMPSWVGFITNGQHELRAMNQAGCKSGLFLVYTLAFLGPWTLVLITIERIISVRNPVLHVKMCTSLKIFIGWVVILVILIGANLHFFWTAHLADVPEVTADVIFACWGSEDYADLYTNIWPWVDFAVSFAGPFIIILICNIVIGATLYGHRTGSYTAGSKLDRVTSTTAMLVTVSIVYLLTTSPIVIFNLLLAYVPAVQQLDLGTVYLITIIVNLVFYLNNAVNCFLYLLFHAYFRKVAKKIFCCRYDSSDLNQSKTFVTDSVGKNIGKK